MKSRPKATKTKAPAPRKQTPTPARAASESPSAEVDLAAPGSQAMKTHHELLRTMKVVMTSNRERRVFGILCVRVNSLKEVKSRFGSAGVEELRRTMYHRLVHCMRTTDLVATTEGGAFLILANELRSEDELEIISDRIQRTCVAPCWIKDQEVIVTLTSGGVGTAGDVAPPVVIGRAMEALAAATAKGLDFDLVRMGETEAGSAQSGAGGDAGNADKGPFALLYVPRFRADGRVAGARVMVELSGGGARAESTSSGPDGRRQRVGDQVLLKVLHQARQWRQSGRNVPTLSIPVGVGQMLDPGFPGFVLGAIAQTETPGDSVELLLTEATIVIALERAVGAMTKLSAGQVRFGLAGFSLDAGTRLDLRKLAFSSLCVSCAPMFKVTTEQESLWLARSVVGVARRCGLQFIAEDVSSVEQRGILLEAGCGLFEGSFLSPPLSAHGLQAIIR